MPTKFDLYKRMSYMHVDVVNASVVNASVVNACCKCKCVYTTRSKAHNEFHTRVSQIEV